MEEAREYFEDEVTQEDIEFFGLEKDEKGWYCIVGKGDFFDDEEIEDLYDLEEDLDEDWFSSKQEIYLEK